MGSGDPYKIGDSEGTTPVGFYDGHLRYKADFSWPGSQTDYQTISGVNGYGLYDMAGNSFEWCNDWFEWNYYSSRPLPDINPTGPSNGTHRVLRGGGWLGGPELSRVAFRHINEPGNTYYDQGFRLILDMEN